jgi:hypothetical protein
VPPKFLVFCAIISQFEWPTIRKNQKKNEIGSFPKYRFLCKDKIFSSLAQIYRWEGEIFGPYGIQLRIVHMLGMVGMYTSNGRPSLLWTTILSMLYNKIKWFKSLLNHPKMNYKLPLDSITNRVSNMTSFLFNTLSVHSWACLS